MSATKRRVSQLLKPTLHVEVVLKCASDHGIVPPDLGSICKVVEDHLLENYVNVTVGQTDLGFKGDINGFSINLIEISDYTGPEDNGEFHKLQDVHLDIIAYVLKPDTNASWRPHIAQPDEDDIGRVLTLPNVALKDEWSSLVFDGALPARLLRCMVRMVSMMSQAGVNLSTFNLNRLCLLHGPSGSGKSTLCRALAQKLSIRLGSIFSQSTLVEINANAMLSKYFGESGKLINNTFEKIIEMAQSPYSLVCVVIDEVETIAGSREKATNGMECNDSLRATNQLLTAIDRLRNLPNVIVLCTSNLVEAIDPAFLDRVDIKQAIPRPSVGAIYNIFRSCLNELVRSNLITTARTPPPEPGITTSKPSPSTTPNRKRLRPSNSPPASPHAPVSTMTSEHPETIPTFAEVNVKLSAQPGAPSTRVLDLARRCEGLSGRTLRRLPILGLTMHTWGGEYSLADAVTALEAAIEEEMKSAARQEREQ